MRSPQLVVIESDGWIAKQLGELAGESRWLVREPRRFTDALALAREPRPAVLFLTVDPGRESADAFAFLADVHRLCPDVPVVAVSEAKPAEDERAAWAALALDLGARYALFPPLSRPVLEDLASGLMAAAVRRLGLGDPAADDKTSSPLPGLGGRRPGSDVIDLADEGIG